jgi:hypothetical protein
MSSWQMSSKSFSIEDAKATVRYLSTKKTFNFQELADFNAAMFLLNTTSIGVLKERIEQLEDEIDLLKRKIGV